MEPSVYYAIGTFIACLGLFGLAAFSVEQRTKEIGVRKVMGASASNIIQLLSKEYIILVTLANLIAWPVAYYSMNKWLHSFAYQTKIGTSVFFLAALFALLIALSTISYQAIKASRTNPVKTLRYE